jgi:hypothetical protein
MNPTRNWNRLVLSVAVASALVGAAHAATIVTDQSYSSTNLPPTNADYEYGSLSPGNTWTIDGSITVGNGSSNYGRLFVGVRDTSTGIIGSGLLTLMGKNGSGDSLVINGYNSSDAVLGRLGHTSGSNYAGTLTIDGGLTVTMGGRKMRYDGGADTINILNGSLNYTTSGFGWTRGSAGSSVNNIIGASGSLVVPGNIADIAGFSAWAVSSGTSVGVSDITVSPANGLSLNFAYNAGLNATLITAVPEPGAAMALLGGTAMLIGLRRRRS